MYAWTFGCLEHKLLCITPKEKPLAIIVHIGSHTVHISVYVLEHCHGMGSRWFHCGVNGNIGTVHSWKQYCTHTPLHYIFYTLHFLTYLLKITSTDANRPVMLLYTLPNQIYNMKALVKMVDSILHHHKWISKMRLACLLLHHEIISTYHCAHFTENYDT
jgi:hypothetical protein